RVAADPAIPPNGGSYRLIDLIAPEGTLVNARFPAAVAAGNVETSQRIADVVLGALARAAPDRVPAASQGTMNNVLIGNEEFAYYETVAGGQGARPWADGQSGIHTGMTNTQNTPIEALHTHYPFRVVAYTLRRRSGGDGAAETPRPLGRRGGRAGIDRRGLPAPGGRIGGTAARRVHRRSPPRRPSGRAHAWWRGVGRTGPAVACPRGRRQPASGRSR